MKYTKIITASFACSLLAGSAFAQTNFNMIADGEIYADSKWDNSLIWTNTHPTPATKFLWNASADASVGESLNLSNRSATIADNQNVAFGASGNVLTLNLNGASNLDIGKAILTYVELNVDGNSTLSTSGKAQIKNDVTVNYNSLVTSVSTSAFQINNATAVFNLNSSGFDIQNTFQHKSGGGMNLNGGDLSFSAYDFDDGTKSGSIDFALGTSSIMTYTGSSIATSAADITFFESLVTAGFIYLDNSAVASTAFDYKFTDGIGLEISIAVPEPGTYALLTGLAVLGLVATRRRRA